MLRQKQLIIFLAITLIFYSCRTARTVIQSSSGESNTAAYIENYSDLAVSEMKRTGIPASITLAQGMIESDFGRSRLAREGNNHFGIKCHNDWTGPTIRHNDDRRNECFRKYSRPEESFYDHSDFLTSVSRYSFLFDIPSDDYKGWARGLKRAGYATNPDYANMLIRKIEELNLHYFDNPVKKPVESDIAAVTEDLVEKPVPDRIIVAQDQAPSVMLPGVMENNRIQFIIVRNGQTRDMIEKEYKLLRWELPRYNELREDFVPFTGQLLYLQPKRDRAEPGKETHQALEGDTMYSVSQKYGLKLQKLYEFNRMVPGEEPAPGTRLWLRSVKPVI